jgi:hypothetical protein
MPGFLADYTVDDFVAFQRTDFPFPCHKHVEESIPQYTAIIRVESLDIPLCRGYVESMKRSAKKPRDKEFAKLVSEIELSPDSMSIFEFINHHEAFNKN